MNKTVERAKEVYNKKGLVVLCQAAIDNIYFKLSKTFSYSKYPTKNIHKSKMILSYDDNGLSKQLYIHKTREPGTTKIIKEIVKPNMIILEIGANIGYYALMEAQLMNDKGIVYALEPFKKSYDLLNKNIELNKYKSIQSYNIACSNKNSKEKLFFSNHYNTCNMNVDKGLGYDLIDTITVDDFLKDKKTPNIVRMDIEGYEYFVIDGMKDTLKKIDFLIMEWHQSAKKDNWKSKINLILNSGLEPVHFIRKTGYRNEEFINFDKKDMMNIIEKANWITIVFKRRNI
jgi:FkbM family methyltransferase